jgi:peptidoglycan/LPS O-acetylase OafA/YrhL
MDPMDPDIPPLTRRYLPQLDGLRAIAVLVVLAVHCITVPQQGRVAWVMRHTLSNGWIGVDLFFALSGFLITSILLGEKSQPHYFRNFYARRALRIFPLYYLVILIVAALAPMHPLWPFLTYTSNLWGLITHREWPLMGHVWSLAIEEQFYLVWPLLVHRLDARALRRLCWIVIAVTPLLRVAVPPGASYFATFCRLDVLAMGALLALTPRIDLRRARIACAILSVVCVAMWVTKQLDFRKLFFNAIGLTIVDATLTLIVCLAVADALPFLRNRLAIAIGRASYGLYLLHYPIALAVAAYAQQELGDSWTRTLVVAAVSLGGTLGLATLSWVAFERPILRLKKRFYA